MTTPARCVLPHHKDPDRPRPARVGFLCFGHRAGLEQNLADLVTLATEAAATLVRHGNPGQRVSGTTEPPLPFHDDISDAFRHTRDVLASWSSVVVEEHPSGLHPPRFGIASCADFLIRWCDWIAEQPWVDDLHVELVQARGLVLAAARPSQARRVDLGQCDGGRWCDVATRHVEPCTGILRATVHTSRDDLPATISCPECGQVHQPEQWSTLSRRLRRELDPMLTMAQLAQVLHVPTSTLRDWNRVDEWRSVEGSDRHGRIVRYHLDDAERSRQARRPDQREEATG